ncbi:hypothetical protein CL618_03010 [archaeon]|nr:hypothetical protein [archaeon]|tara:strand:+ start:10904 stop:11356 length:453 start_codon:yes stop_codon:yes gene_type:complete
MARDNSKRKFLETAIPVAAGAGVIGLIGVFGVPSLVRDDRAYLGIKENEANEHFSRGLAHFEKKRLRDAVKEFNSGYEVLEETQKTFNEQARDGMCFAEVSYDLPSLKESIDIFERNGSLSGLEEILPVDDLRRDKSYNDTLERVYVADL